MENLRGYLPYHCTVIGWNYYSSRSGKFETNLIENIFKNNGKIDKIIFNMNGRLRVCELLKY